MDERAMNFSGQYKLYDPEIKEAVTVIGGGAVGGWVVMGLAKQGVRRITVYDDDFVESHNAPASVYGPDDVARVKLEALCERVERDTGAIIGIAHWRHDGSGPFDENVVCCVDDMDGRIAIWNAIQARRPEVKRFVDTRINEELVSVFAIDPNDPKDADYYAHFLYPREEAEPTMCGRHGIWYVSVFAAGTVCANLTRWWTHGTKKRHHVTLAGALESIK